MRAFVTVGATAEFDLLVESIISSNVLEALQKKGYDELVIQVGPSTRFGVLSEQREGISLDMWKLKPTLKDDFEKSDLIISHAGSGSILDALRLHKPLIVVPNPALLDNHQSELALALEKRRFLKSTTISGLAATIKAFDPQALLPFPKVDGAKFRSILDEEMGYEP
ncbi:glycosyltransferase family 1 protein [Sphaerobolus stellatus SS14]|uniref:UDP-N-acetylglucosamine transferase subunit ALG13 n=1 Tax=Sphaerobolus stellatus (strain SS14) TaxID=990650 RepID=A0A0C9VYJ8_SPHS4|nr:glycosyltransferase family 1 protein [Sphaerobolus stellatus SS14]